MATINTVLSMIVSDLYDCGRGDCPIRQELLDEIVLNGYLIANAAFRICGVKDGVYELYKKGEEWWLTVRCCPTEEGWVDPPALDNVYLERYLEEDNSFERWRYEDCLEEIFENCLVEPLDLSVDPEFYDDKDFF